MIQILSRLAFRNLFRHKTRLFLNLSLLIGAFAAIVLFKGFKQYVLEYMKQSIIETQYGHLDIAQKTYWNNSAVDVITEKMISDSHAIVEKVKADPEVEFVTPRVHFFGLVNTEDKSVPARFIGLNPQVEVKMQQNMKFTEGQAFQASKTATLGFGLAKQLKVKPGDQVTVVSPTLEGGINAMDLTITGLFSTGWADVDNGSIYLSLQDAQKILDTDYVDQLLVSLKDDSNLAISSERISGLIKDESLQVKTWLDLSDLYLQVEPFFNFQNLIIEVIILALLILSISNTTNMTIFERMGEIGTLRALGDYERDIQLLFFIEAMMLGLLGIIISIPVATLLIYFVSSLNIPMVLPFTSQPIPLKIVPLFWAYLEASGVCFLSIILASLWPARKGSRVSIVTALRAKI